VPYTAALLAAHAPKLMSCHPSRRKRKSMGMCLSDFGGVSVEVRRESFIIHAEPVLRDGETDKRWAENPHPELPLEELDNLIEALKDAKKYLEKTRGRR
jgi:hypothetical protein